MVAGRRGYNVAPTDTIATVVFRHSERPVDASTRRVRLALGLIPSNKAGPAAPDAKGPPLINARADK